jgi:hypothetical protein
MAGLLVAQAVIGGLSVRPGSARLTLFVEFSAMEQGF